MHRSSLALVFGALSLSVCGPETAADPQFEEVCGTVGPHRLLALTAGEWLYPASATRIGDRVYFVAGTGEDSFLFEPIPETATVYSTGPCGEERRTIADDIRDVFEREQLPGVVLGCGREVWDDLYVLDPAGEVAPRLLVPGGCPGLFTDHGILHQEETADDVVRLLLYPYPPDLAAGPLEPIVLAESLDRSRYGVTNDAAGDAVFVRSTEGDLLRIALPGGETTVEQPDVGEFDISQDGRYLVWEDRLTASGEDGGPAGDFILRDRQTGVETVLAQAPHPFLLLHVWTDSIRLSSSDGGTRLVALPSLTATDIPADWRLFVPLLDGRWLVAGEDGAWYIVDLAADTELLVTRDPGTLYGANPENLRLRRSAPGSEDDGHDQLWNYPLNGDAPELLAERVTIPDWLEDDRIYTLVDVDDRGLGDLVLIDPVTLAERKLDGSVLQVGNIFGWSSNVVDRDTIAYQVLDGERSGFWIVRPAGE